MRWPLAFALVFAVSTVAPRVFAQDTPAPAPPAEQPAPTAPTAPVEVAPPPTAPVDVPPPEAQPQPTSIVVDATDDAGHPLRAVTVYVDDQPVAYELDGKPILLPPGPHTIRLQWNEGEHAPVSTTLNLGANESARPVHLSFPHAEESVSHQMAMRPDPPVVPRIVVAVGLVAMITGAVVVLARPALPANCNDTCTRNPGETDAQFAANESKAKSHDDVTHAATATLVGGAALTASGLLWYFIELPPIRQDASLTPWMGASGGGLVYRSRF